MPLAVSATWPAMFPAALPAPEEGNPPGMFEEEEPTGNPVGYCVGYGDGNGVGWRVGDGSVPDAAVGLLVGGSEGSLVGAAVVGAAVVGAAVVGAAAGATASAASSPSDSTRLYTRASRRAPSKLFWTVEPFPPSVVSYVTLLGLTQFPSVLVHPEAVTPLRYRVKMPCLVSA